MEKKIKTKWVPNNPPEHPMDHYDTSKVTAIVTLVDVWLAIWAYLRTQGQFEIRNRNQSEPKEKAWGCSEVKLAWTGALSKWE